MKDLFANLRSEASYITPHVITRCLKDSNKKDVEALNIALNALFVKSNQSSTPPAEVVKKWMRDEESVCLLIENVAYLIKQKLISAQTIEAVEWGIHMVLDERLPKHSRLVYDFLKAVVEFWNGINHAETKRTARCALTKRTCLTSRSRQATARINTKEHPGVCLDPNYSPPSLNRVKKNRHSSLTEIRNAQLAEQLEKRRTSSVDRRNAWNIERSLKRSASETEKRQQKQELEARKLDREKDRKIKEAARKEERKRQEEKRKEAMREYALRKKRL